MAASPSRRDHEATPAAAPRSAPVVNYWMRRASSASVVENQRQQPAGEPLQAVGAVLAVLTPGGVVRISMVSANYTTAEAADVLEIEVRELRKMIKDGLIAAQKIDGRFRFKIEDVLMHRQVRLDCEQSVFEANQRRERARGWSV